MKVELDLMERRYLYGLFRLFAVTEQATDPVKARFWVDMMERMGPNQAFAKFRRKEVELLIELLSEALRKAQERITPEAIEKGLHYRAEALEKVLSGAKTKLEAKLASLNKENENGMD